MRGAGAYYLGLMKRPANKATDYLSFTRKERVAIVAVALIMIAAPLFSYVLVLTTQEPIADHSAFEKELAALKMREPDSSRHYIGSNYHDHFTTDRTHYLQTGKTELFYFDPNTISVSDWQRLGIREKTAGTIRNYISKGGHFYKPEDIGKIWGLHEDEVKRLLPYVKIVQKENSTDNKYPVRNRNSSYGNLEYTSVSVDVNSSDTAAFIALPGIGSKLAARIVAFREKLGGFYKAAQIAETYGLPDSVFQKIKNKLVLANTQVKKLNINTATLDELKAHPYLRYSIANAIVQYRAMHGNYSAVSDIKKITVINDETYEKASPYLIVK